MVSRLSTLTRRSAPKPPDLLRLDHQLCFALYSSSLLMTKLYKPAKIPSFASTLAALSA